MSERDSGPAGFISWRPEEYGYDRRTYAAVVVISKGQKKDVYPARNSDEAMRLLRVLSHKE